MDVQSKQSDEKGRERTVDDTVYHYFYPLRTVSSIIGIKGKIVKQMRVDTKSEIDISRAVQGCEVRAVTLYSTSEKTNSFGDGDKARVCRAQAALFRIHERVIGSEERGSKVAAWLLVPSYQTRCLIGKDGRMLQSIRCGTGAQVRVLTDDHHLPACASRFDELVQISGEAAAVKAALFQVTSRLRDNPSRLLQFLASAPPDAKYFSIRMVCPVANIGGMIGEDWLIIDQIMHESGASIKLRSYKFDGDNC